MTSQRSFKQNESSHGKSVFRPRKSKLTSEIAHENIIGAVWGMSANARKLGAMNVESFQDLISAC